MIVKKIGRRKAAPIKSKAANVRALVDYIAGPRAGGDGEKVEHRGALNLLNSDHEAQVQEMIDLAETARRSSQPVQHWILSWREGEQPTVDQADESVTMFAREMGLAEHQVIYALHRDTHNWHLHLAINRVHPDTEKLVTVNNRFDHDVAHRAIARIEQRQGWEPEAHAIYGLGAAGDISRISPRDREERKVSVRARNFEERRGEQSAERIGIEEVAPIIRHAVSWRELHERLTAKGFRFERKGSGALLWIGEQPVKASAVGRDCSMSALRERLGEFEPVRSDREPVLVPPRPIAQGQTSALYVEQRHQHLERSSGRRQLIAKQQEEWHQLSAWHRQELVEIFRGSWTGRGDLLNALRSVTAARHAQENAELRDLQRLERAQLRRKHRPFPSYEDWLAREDRDAADQWRHRERRPATIEGPTFRPPVPRDIRAARAVVDGWKVNYYMARARRVGPSFTDRGKTIDIYDTKSRESILAALQLSAQKWGTISVYGDERFKRICAELAAEHGFKITNPELQQAIAVERERRMAPKENDCQVTSEVHRSEPMTPSAIYRRHIDAIVVEQPSRAADPSRLDAEVAVRMAVTRHSREQITSAIKTGASADRPRERRAWDRYAQRAADFAFSPPGRVMQNRLGEQRQKLIDLEGRQHQPDIVRGLGGPGRHL